MLAMSLMEGKRHRDDGKRAGEKEGEREKERETERDGFLPDFMALRTRKYITQNGCTGINLFPSLALSLSLPLTLSLPHSLTVSLALFLFINSRINGHNWHGKSTFTLKGTK